MHLAREKQPLELMTSSSTLPVERGHPDDVVLVSAMLWKRAEEKLRESEARLAELRSELAHVARVTSLGALTASIAHEINQPLSGVVTNASTCRHAGERPAQHRRRARDGPAGHPRWQSRVRGDLALARALFPEATRRRQLNWSRPG